jgi:hypothetical protein
MRVVRSFVKSRIFVAVLVLSIEISLERPADGGHVYFIASRSM